MNEFATYIPMVVIAIIAVFLAFTLRGKQIPDRAVGIAAPIAGIVLLYLLSDSVPGLLFGLALIAVGGFAWYRHYRDRKLDAGPDQSL